MSLLGPGNREGHTPNTLSKLEFGPIREILLSLGKLSPNLVEELRPEHLEHWGSQGLTG